MNRNILDLVKKAKEELGLRSKEALHYAKRSMKYQEYADMMNRAFPAGEFTAHDAFNVIGFLDSSGRYICTTISNWDRSQTYDTLEKTLLPVTIKEVCKYLEKFQTAKSMSEKFWLVRIDTRIKDPDLNKEAKNSLNKHLRYRSRDLQPLLDDVDCGIHNVTTDVADGLNRDLIIEELFDLPYARAARENTLNKPETEQQILSAYMASKNLFAMDLTTLRKALDLLEEDAEDYELYRSTGHSSIPDTRSPNKLLMDIKQLVHAANSRKEADMESDAENPIVALFENTVNDRKLSKIFDANEELRQAACVFYIGYLKYLRKVIALRLSRL